MKSGGWVVNSARFSQIKKGLLVGKENRFKTSVFVIVAPDDCRSDLMLLV
ncbi:hypothetical protein VCHA38O209_20066 [Vibrio chagasii]|nr:hypothetical protein VCHA36P164_100103 [Vibrio chagasii]CAH7111769.1 hypothetical protein VCHA48P437_10418 [Vibrio chagasii]CAH7230578.1 hypothetical protein VCHA44O286_20324 [Vibrio chagasii]CAH7230763.1 hypothetical protein VCHA40O237_30322 [Vibrio chagasii]CAH7368475.1 hypothetical protein VCHA40P242_80108 [Vibrio chagasii]